MFVNRPLRLALLMAAACAVVHVPQAAEAAYKHIPGVPVYGQYPELPAGCEATAVTMVMQWAGARATKVDVANAIPRESLPYEAYGRLFGGDPHQGFVGDPYQKEGSFGVFAAPMVSVVDRWLPGRGVNLTGATFQELLRIVEAGRPVAAWVTNSLQEPEINARWYTDMGRSVIWRSPEHVMTLVGFTDTEVIVNDPAHGVVRRYNKDRFAHIYNVMGRHALTVSQDMQPKFAVYQASKWLWEFPTIEGAIQYAKQWDHARIVETSTGQTKWDNIYSQVFQYDRYLGDFASQQGAIGFAKRWDHAKVIDASTRVVTWNNYPKHVYQNQHLIREFRANETFWAIEYAKGYADSRVIDTATGQVLWQFK